jgi:two-component system CheB/CheR fusion protein
MRLVLIQHLDPCHEGMLTDIIAKTTRMRVEEVKSGVTIQPGCQVSKKPD